MAEIEIASYECRPDARTLTERATFVVTDYPTGTDEALLTYAAELKTGRQDVAAAFPDRLPTVHPVQEMARPLLDPFHNVMLSTTKFYFPLHTDEYFTESPSRFVLLLCLTPAEIGGTTLVAHVDDIAADLDAQTRMALMKPVYPTQVGPRPLLEETADGLSIRFNELEVMRAKEFNQQFLPLPEESRRAIAQLRAAAERRTRRYDLKTGDCLVIHNHRTLHGRTAFSGSAHRLMKRVRIK
jgi:alpha-ketoglutarate-dependent taurine dioxygenase